MWQILPIILIFVCGWAGGVMGLIWFSSKRDQVEQAAQRGGPGPYGYGPPPQQYGAPQQPYGAPPPGWGPPPAPGTSEPATAAARIPAAADRRSNRRCSVSTWVTTTSARSASKFPTRSSTTSASGWLAPVGPTRSRARVGTTAPTSPTCRTSASTGRTKFDWRAQEERFNRWPHFLTEIDGQQIHFIHARSDDPDALPLIVTHGWPGSVAEFLDVIEPLRENFHVVVPSLPGYGWSGPTIEPGWDVQRVADAWAMLMARLGYDRYGAQGGDWGAMMSARLAATDVDHVIGLHSNMLLGLPRRRERDPAHRRGGGRPRRGRRVHEDRARRTRRSRARTRRRSATASPTRRPGSRAGSSRSSWSGPTTTAAPKTRSRAISSSRTSRVYWVTKTINSSIRLYCESSRTASLRAVGRVRRRAHRRGGVPEGDLPDPARLRGDALQPRPLHALRPRRPLRRARGARPAGRRRTSLLRRVGLTCMIS